MAKISLYSNTSHHYPPPPPPPPPEVPEVFSSKVVLHQNLVGPKQEDGEDVVSHPYAVGCGEVGSFVLANTKPGFKIQKRTKCRSCKQLRMALTPTTCFPFS